MRKKEYLDGIDKEILRTLVVKSPLVSSIIAKKVGLTPSSIFPRLNNLEKKGILKKAKTGNIRKFTKNIKGYKTKIKSYSSIYWEIDLE